MDKRQGETISEDEFAELTALTDQLEAYGARRLEALVELAELRGITLDKLTEDLGIRPSELDRQLAAPRWSD